MLNEYNFVANEIQTGNYKLKAAGIKKSENITVTYKRHYTTVSSIK